MGYYDMVIGNSGEEGKDENGNGNGNGGGKEKKKVCEVWGRHRHWMALESRYEAARLRKECSEKNAVEIKRLEEQASSLEDDYTDDGDYLD